MALFYVPLAATVNQQLELTETEAQHAIRVLRMRPGDKLELANGNGQYFKAEITEATNKKCTVRILEEIPITVTRANPIKIALAPTKNLDRIEWLVEKATEIGCDEFYFLLCRHSERKELKLDRLEKVAISAMKQARQPFLPKLHTLQPFKDFITGANPAETAIAHLTGDPNQPSLAQVAQQKAISTVIIGPEGDFSEEELQLAHQHGITCVLLGSSRLRTETAALVACTTLSIFA